MHFVSFIAFVSEVAAFAVSNGAHCNANCSNKKSILYGTLTHTHALSSHCDYM